jgi:hypothetical protein
VQSLRDIDDVVTHTLNFDDCIDVVNAAVVVRISLLEAVDLILTKHCAVVVDRDLAINCNLEVLGENGESSSENGYGSFYVLRSFADKIIEDAKRMINEEEIDAVTKY